MATWGIGNGENFKQFEGGFAVEVAAAGDNYDQARPPDYYFVTVHYGDNRLAYHRFDTVKTDGEAIAYGLAWGERWLNQEGYIQTLNESEDKS